jgi:uncharacterized NAD-dependent epimerase/dehydratase family protein
VDAGKLAAGDRLMALSGEAVAVDDVWTEALDEPVTVYNLQIADFHTYYAGGICVLVHNADYEESEAIIKAREEGILEGSGHASPDHKEAIDNKLEELLKTEEYEKIFANRGMSTVNNYLDEKAAEQAASGAEVKNKVRLVGTQRPDIIAIKKDGTIEIWEFESPSQYSGTPHEELIEKIKLMRANNPRVIVYDLDP